MKGVYPLAPSPDTVGPLGQDIAALELGMRLLEPSFLVPDARAELSAGRIATPLIDGGPDPAVDAAVDRADLVQTACCGGAGAATLPVTLVMRAGYQRLCRRRAAGVRGSSL